MIDLMNDHDDHHVTAELLHNSPVSSIDASERDIYASERDIYD